jgi:hypothetical protein
MTGERTQRCYEIVVEGVAGPAIESAFSDCRIDVRTAATLLVPLVSDEAAFYAVLERVRDLGLTVLEVRRLEGPPAVHDCG